MESSDLFEKSDLSWNRLLCQECSPTSKNIGALDLNVESKLSIRWILYIIKTGIFLDSVKNESLVYDKMNQY